MKQTHEKQHNNNDNNMVLFLVIVLWCSPTMAKTMSTLSQICAANPEIWCIEHCVFQVVEVGERMKGRGQICSSVLVAGVNKSGAKGSMTLFHSK